MPGRSTWSATPVDSPRPTVHFTVSVTYERNGVKMDDRWLDLWERYPLDQPDGRSGSGSGITPCGLVSVPKIRAKKQISVVVSRYRKRCGGCRKCTDQQIVAAKGLLSAAEEQQTKNKHNFSHAGRLNRDMVDRGWTEFPCQSLMFLFLLESARLCSSMFWLRRVTRLWTKINFKGKRVCHRLKSSCRPCFHPVLNVWPETRDGVSLAMLWMCLLSSVTPSRDRGVWVQGTCVKSTLRFLAPTWDDKGYVKKLNLFRK